MQVQGALGSLLYRCARGLWHLIDARAVVPLGELPVAKLCGVCASPCSDCARSIEGVGRRVEVVGVAKGASVDGNEARPIVYSGLRHVVDGG